MRKISEKQKEILDAYAHKKCANLLDAIYCKTKDEVNAVCKCTQIVKQNRLLYFKAVNEAPHNVEYNMNQRQKAYQEIEGRYDEYNIGVAFQQRYPLVSDVQTIKNEINDLCRDVLLSTGSFGKKRIAKIIAALRTTLTDDDEEFEDLDEFNELMKDLSIFL